MTQVKARLTTLICILLLATSGAIVGAEQQQPLPTDYEKWGKIAVDVAKLNYPESQISDYQYKGREEITDTQAKDTFELKVQGKERTFTARVMILFNPKTETLMSLSIEEVK
ncbi:DUF3889 domain-containing protein [Fredinandcohnia sp. 179-A 10B2 NHS]|uniref:DUF3889 domain-containing protein n=1 Tax=Fredinandcohnia sp. 179-A 10B2 NHS TaxID=3235176 RepID=UPI0039A1C32F